MSRWHHVPSAFCLTTLHEFQVCSAHLPFISDFHSIPNTRHYYLLSTVSPFSIYLYFLEELPPSIRETRRCIRYTSGTSRYEQAGWQPASPILIDRKSTRLNSS